jgi:tetratricopeptide (TPR) repeat protein
LSSRIARRLLVGVVACVLLIVAGCGSTEQRFAEHVKNADQYQQEGKDKEALLELRAALQLEPKSADVNFRIGQLMEQQNKLADAVFFYGETIRLDPKRNDAKLAEAKLVMFDDSKRADALVDEVLKDEPKNATAYIRRSEVALARSDADAALQAALTATELQPNEGMGYMQLGIVQEARIRELRVKRKDVPEDLFEAAVAAFQKADERFHGGPNARIEMGRVYAVWPGHDKEAEAAYRSAVSAAQAGEPRGRAAAAAAGYARTAGDDAFLSWSLNQVVENVPQSLLAWQELASLAERTEAGGGEKVYQRLLEVRPQDEDAHVRYAQFLAAHGRYDEAIAHLKSQSESGSDPADALEAMVALQLGKGDLDSARGEVAQLQKDYPSHAKTSLAAGRLALAERRFDDAVESLRTYVGQEESVDGQRLLALAEVGRRNYPAAVAAVDRAIQLQGGEGPSAELLRLKAQIHQASGDWQQVLATLRRMARLGMQPLPMDQLLFAHALYQTGRRDAGKQVLEKLLATPAPPAAAYLEYAVEEQKADPDKARSYLERVLKQQPRNEMALRLLIVQDLAAKHPDVALARLDEAAKSGPLPPTLVLVRAQVLLAKKDYAGAEQEARRAFAAAPNMTPALDLLAQIYASQNRMDEAIASFEEAEKVGALPPAGEVLLARLHLASGHMDRAKQLYEKALAADQNLPGAKNDLAFILAEQNQDLDRALQLAQDAQKAAPESPDFVDTLGYVYLRKGLNDAAVEQFRFALELDKKSGTQHPDYQYHLGLALRAQGQQAEAAEAFAAALALDPHFSHADDARRELEAARASASKTSG